MDVKVGCCGFPKARSKYYECFRVVEVQQTFYQPPTPATVARWREQAPPDFEFTLKAWQLITHESKSPTYRRLGLSWPQSKLGHCGSFKPTDEVQWAWERTREVATGLRAKVVVFQTPASFQPCAAHKENLRNFFKKADRGDLLLIWEPRGSWGDEEVLEVCREFHLVHGVDPFKNDPSFGGIRYFRIHGISGYRHRFSEAELEVLREKAQGPCYCLFNNVSMWTDALAFQNRIEGRGRSPG